MPEPRQPLKIDASRISRQGNLQLENLAGEAIIAEKALRRLEIVASPDLFSLDLSGCSDRLQLSIDRIAGLRWVRMPEGPAGSMVELQLPERLLTIAPLEIRGRVAEVELKASWLVIAWTPVGELGESPLDGLFIGAPDRAPAEVRAAVHLLVGPGAEKDTLELDCQDARHLVIKGCRARELILNNANLQTLDIGECRLLESIGGGFRAEQARISVCRALQQVSGSGQDLNIGCAGADDLDIGGEWESVSIFDGGFETLSVRRSQKVELKALPDLRFLEYEHIGSLAICSDTTDPDRLTAWFADQPGRLGHWLGGAAGTAGSTTEPFNPLMDRWAHRATAQGEFTRLAGILASLTELAGNHEDIAAVWALRCALLTACIKRAGSELGADLGEHTWYWGVDPRANPAVWLQDLALLQACKNFPAAADTLQSMTRQGSPAAVWALARALSDSALPAERRQLLGEWLRGSLEHLDLRIEDDAPLVRGLPKRPPPANAGFAGRLAHAARHEHIPSLLPDLARMIRKLDPEGMSETLARRMVDHIPDAGDLLIEVGLDFHRTGAAGARMLLATGLSSAGNLPATRRAEVMEALLAWQGRD